jgi:hypothetical protein
MANTVYVKIPVLAVTVWLNGDKKDWVTVQTIAPSPSRANSKEKFSIQFETASGKGKAYVEKWFGVHPLVIDKKTGGIVQNFVGYRSAFSEEEVTLHSPTSIGHIEDTTAVPSVPTSTVVSTDNPVSCDKKQSHFTQPVAENITLWKALVYDNKFYTVYGMSDNEWFPFICKATRPEALSWFNSKGKTIGEQVLSDALDAG